VRVTEQRDRETDGQSYGSGGGQRAAGRRAAAGSTESKCCSCRMCVGQLCTADAAVVPLSSIYHSTKCTSEGKLSPGNQVTILFADYYDVHQLPLQPQHDEKHAAPVSHSPFPAADCTFDADLDSEACGCSEFAFFQPRPTAGSAQAGTGRERTAHGKGAAEEKKTK
jgi:hypothetical protein